MWLLDKMLRKVVVKGELVITDHDGKEYRYGAPEAGREPIRVRLTDRGAAWHISKDPRIGAGEAYMDGRLVIEPPHNIRDLLLFIRYNAPVERGGDLKPRGALRKTVNYVAARLDGINWRARSRHNAEHTYNLTRRLFELFLDEDRQYTCAYYRNLDDTLEQAQLDKKAHIAAKLNLKPGMKVLDIGCGWGGLALYLHRHYDVDVLGVALAPDQIDFANERAAEEGVSDRVKFKLMDYRDVEAMRYHYAHTLEEWYRRTEAAREEMIELYDERFHRMWQFYLAGAESAFRYGGMVNWQLQYVRRRDALPMTREPMYEEEKRLLAAEKAPEWHLRDAAE